MKFLIHDVFVAVTACSFLQPFASEVYFPMFNKSYGIVYIFSKGDININENLSSRNLYGI